MSGEKAFENRIFALYNALDVEQRPRNVLVLVLQNRFLAAGFKDICFEKFRIRHGNPKVLPICPGPDFQKLEAYETLNEV